MCNTCAFLVLLTIPVFVLCGYCWSMWGKAELKAAMLKARAEEREASLIKQLEGARYRGDWYHGKWSVLDHDARKAARRAVWDGSKVRLAAGPIALPTDQHLLEEMRKGNFNDQ